MMWYDVIWHDMTWHDTLQIVKPIPNGQHTTHPPTVTHSSCSCLKTTLAHAMPSLTWSPIVSFLTHTSPSQRLLLFSSSLLDNKFVYVFLHSSLAAFVQCQVVNRSPPPTQGNPSIPVCLTASFHVSFLHINTFQCCFSVSHLTSTHVQYSPFSASSVFSINVASPHISISVLLTNPNLIT